MALGVLANGRTTDAYALATGAALVHDGNRIARAVDETAGAVEDEHREVIRTRSLLERGLDRLVILGIDATDIIDAERTTQRLDIESRGFLDGEGIRAPHLLMQGDPVAGIALAAGHGRGAIIEYAQRAHPGVVDGTE